MYINYLILLHIMITGTYIFSILIKVNVCVYAILAMDVYKTHDSKIQYIDNSMSKNILCTLKSNF
jgi:hypothetical protein